LSMATRALTDAACCEPERRAPCRPGAAGGVAVVEAVAAVRVVCDSHGRRHRPGARPRRRTCDWIPFFERAPRAAAEAAEVAGTTAPAPPRPSTRHGKGSGERAKTHEAWRDVRHASSPDRERRVDGRQTGGGGGGGSGGVSCGRRRAATESAASATRSSISKRSARAQTALAPYGADAAPAALVAPGGAARPEQSLTASMPC
jgi:hypothetical protein